MDTAEKLTICLLTICSTVSITPTFAADTTSQLDGLLLHSQAAVTQVAVSEPAIVHADGAKPPYYLPQTALTRLHDGTLILAGNGHRQLQSCDKGLTWQEQQDPLTGYRLLQLRDGTFCLLQSQSEPGGRSGVFQCGRLRLKRLEDLHAPVTPSWQPVSLTVEQFKSVVGDDYTTIQAGPSPEIATELEDGTLLALCYGNFTEDHVPIRGFHPTIGEAPMYRTYLISSTDGGDTWHYLSTVAYDGSTGQESFCEPCLVNFGGGELLAVMRTGRFAPLHQARSLDGGKTWGTPQSLETLGLQPRITLLQNGILVCSFGWRPLRNIYWQDTNGGYYPAGLADYHERYKSQVGIEDPSAAAGDYVMFSPDRGHTWSEPRKIAEPLTQGYTQIAATGPDSCLVLSYRYVLPGRSPAQILHIWQHESQTFLQDMRTLYEARRITVRP